MPEGWYDQECCVLVCAGASSGDILGSHSVSHTPLKLRCCHCSGYTPSGAGLLCFKSTFLASIPCAWLISLNIYFFIPLSLGLFNVSIYCMLCSIPNHLTGRLQGHLTPGRVKLLVQIPINLGIAITATKVMHTNAVGPTVVSRN